MRRRIAPALIASIVVLSLSVGACGSATATESDASESTPTSAATTDVSFLSESAVHEIAFEYDDNDYLQILDAYTTDGSKEWIIATVTIDGVTYENVGVRLKGNSSLFGLGGRQQRPGGSADANSPESLPWLIRLDKYTDGQNHNGIYDIVVRSNNSETALNEAVALDLLELAGLASQDSAYASFTVNGSDPVLRLVMEHPDDVWMERTLGGEGSLYKAESTGDYSYRGDDPAAYDDVFDLEAGGDEDLSDLIDFLDFLNNSDDASFYANLETRLDTHAFATYLAMQDLIANADDIDGRGNNSYLYYDDESGVFTVVPWDHNLAFGVKNQAVGGLATPEGRPPGAGVGRGNAGQPIGEGPGPTGLEVSNVLVDRFLADPDYNAMYQEALAELTASLYDSGTASEVLAGWVEILESEAGHLVAAATLRAEASVVAGFFE